MKKLSRFVVPAFVALLAAPVLLAQDAKPADTKPAAAKPAAAKPKAAAQIVTMTPDQLTWVDIPNSNGAKNATAWGDPSKGAHGAFHKFPGGFVAPLHTHPGDVRIVVISGTVIAGTEDGKETKVPAGGYIYQPHTVKHVTKCDPASECLIFASSDKKFDILPADGKAGAEKKEAAKK